VKAAEEVQPVQGAQQPERVSAADEEGAGLAHSAGRIAGLVQPVDADADATQGLAHELGVGAGVAAGEGYEQDPGAVAQDGPDGVGGVLEERHPRSPRVRQQQQFGHPWHSSGRSAQGWNCV